MRFVVTLSSITYHPADYHLMPRHARVVEEAGLHGVAIQEHVVTAEGKASREPAPGLTRPADAERAGDSRYAQDLESVRAIEGPPHPTIPWAEPLAVLAAAAAVTSRIELLTALLIAPLRPAVVLAKQAATVDQLSGGRLRLGVGPSYVAEEYAAAGIPFADRGQRLDDSLGACRALWAQSPASYRSPTVTLDRIYCEPRPAVVAQREFPGPDLLIAGPLNRRNLRRVARYGSGWLPWERRPEILRTEIEQMREAVAAAGRDPTKLDFMMQINRLDAEGNRGGWNGRADIDRTLETIPELEAAGITTVTWPTLAFADHADSVTGAIERLARSARDYL